MERIRVQPFVPDVTEKTGGQTNQVASMDGVLYKNMPASYATYRAMRKDPTIAMARTLIISMVLSGEWSVEADDDAPDEWVKFIQDTITKHRMALLHTAISGSIDFGWAPFEVVYGLKDGKVVVDKLKSLLQDLTTILVWPDTGEFRGYRQRDMHGTPVDILDEYCFHLGFRVEGTDWYGNPLLENSRDAWNKWNEADAGAARYDRKVAGSHFVVTYPIGETLYNGVMTNNAEIAKMILRALESSGSVVVPDQMLDLQSDNADARPRWKIEILEDATQKQPGFVERERYLDTLKIRGLTIPERSVSEGQFGTKAEASAHQNIAVLNLQITDQYIADQLNEKVVDSLLLLNFGTDAIGKVRIKPSPLTDDELEFLSSIYDKILTSPNGFLEEFPMIDTDAIKDQLGIPKRLEVALPNNQLNPLEPPDPNVPPGATPEQLALLAGFIPRTEDGKWTYDASGLVTKFGPELAVADDAFRQARRFAEAMKWDEAREVLFSIPRAKDFKAHFATQRRTSQMLERILQLEMKQRKTRNPESLVGLFDGF